jgi:hypothetical protein
MWELTEAKADTDNLITFAGKDLADRFLAIKNKLKTPENDLYYWIKNKTPEELEQTVLEIENSKSKTQHKKDIADQGAELIKETAHWKIYHITTYEASQKYGRDTTWCITGINNYGDKYWTRYINQNMQFYFLITKGTYDPRGTNSKFAIAVYPHNNIEDFDFEIFNQRDESVLLKDIPYNEEITIPGVNLRPVIKPRCHVCGQRHEAEDLTIIGPAAYCPTCTLKYFNKCKECGEYSRKNFGYEDSGNFYCYSCSLNDIVPSNFGGCYYELKHKANHPALWLTGKAYSEEELITKLTTRYPNIDPRLNLCLSIISHVSGELLFEATGKITDIITKLKNSMTEKDYMFGVSEDNIESYFSIT